MASQPIKREMILKLAALAEPPNPDTPTDEVAFAYLLSYMENGGRLSTLAASLNVSRWLLDRWVKADPERKAQFSSARALGADALIDEGGDILDHANRDTIAVANARAGWRKWLAGKYDPDTYGERQAPQVGVAIGQLHYHAALTRPALLPPHPLSLPPTPFTVESPPLVGSLDPARERGYPTATEGVLHVEQAPLESVGLG